MPIPVTFAIFIAVLATTLFGFDAHRKDRIFQREVLIARDLVKVCEAGGPTNQDCVRIRQVALYGPVVPEEELVWIKVCDERKKASSLSFSQAFFERCQKARTRVMELSGKAASIQSQEG